jgi:hypothetical protein
METAGQEAQRGGSGCGLCSAQHQVGPAHHSPAVQEITQLLGLVELGVVLPVETKDIVREGWK